MYEVLIAHLRECAKLDPRENTYAEAADAIELLQKTQQPKWIPVSERLPEAWEEVMLQFPNNQAAGFFDGDCGWGVFSGDDFYTYVAPEEVHPTHWAKKLPEPPKGEEE